MISENTIKIFEKLSGWTEKEKYEREHGGHITIEEDIRTGDANAFLWTMSDDDSYVVHLQYMFLYGLVFVK